MAIYHLSAKIVSRAKGQSVVAAAAYRSSEALYDQRYGLTHDYTRKQGVEHTEILAPDEAPAWVNDRESLWNQVEAKEARKDSQLAREIELGLPIELTHAERVELVRNYVKTQFVSKGMIADLSVHEDDPNNPHAHVLLTLREISPQGFGAKVRGWNAKADLLQWREAWAERANEHLAHAGLGVRIDHRTLEAQGSVFTPGRKIGIGKERQEEKQLPRHMAERIAEQKQIARDNGELILADPKFALKALSHQRATFTQHDIAKFLHTRTEGAEQFQAAYLKVTTSPELVALGKDERAQVRYTTRDMLEAEHSLLNRSRAMERRPSHGVAELRQESALSQSRLSAQQKEAFAHVVGEGDLKALVGVAGSGKSTLLAAARHAWEAEGLTVKGAALSGIAAENLQIASGVHSRTLASYEWAWGQGRDPLTRNDVLVIDEAGMIGTKQLERMLAAADKARAKVVLIGDPEQLQAIEAGAAFRGIVAEVGMAELTQVRRQQEAWAREATQALASGKTALALSDYEAHGRVIAADTRADARQQLLQHWAQDAKTSPNESRLILAYTRDDVQDLNQQARALRSANHELGKTASIKTTRGDREFAANDRIVFLRNEKSLGVKNGTLGTIENIDHGVLQVRLDGRDEIRVVIDSRDYQDLDLGYASTIHKAQGATVDRSYVLASRYFDRHTSYVALSRHRESAALYYAREDFAGRPGHETEVTPAQAYTNLVSILSRQRSKDLAHDYLEREVEFEAKTPIAERLAPAETERHALEKWKAFSAGQVTANEIGKRNLSEQKLDRSKDHDRGRSLDDDYGL